MNEGNDDDLLIDDILYVCRILFTGKDHSILASLNLLLHHKNAVPTFKKELLDLMSNQNDNISILAMDLISCCY